MSSSSVVNDITAMSHRFVVKWGVPTRDLKSVSASGRVNTHRFSSNRYRFKNIKNLEFSYIMTCERDYRMTVSCVTDMPMFQDDALVLIKDRVYRVKCNHTNTLGKLIFDPIVLAENTFEDDKVIFHCIMSIPAQVESVMDSGVQFKIPGPDSDVLPVNIIECESIVTYPDIYPYDYNAVSEFGYSSRIPDFNVKMAVGMIVEAHKRSSPILKALCSEYLMENLTIENVAQVLKQSLECDAMDLSKKCADFLSKHCRIVSH